MEPLIIESNPKQTENQDVNKTESAENFQKFIYELFDKNGILNDLRAYLRGHIVNVLKNALTGDPPTCQKHFTQRLDSTFQALNMLVAEYLLCLEFNYSLSVFVSEIPLANMVFGFAKSLMDLGADGEANGLRFGEDDVCSILNYLGIKCDAEHITKIVEMYMSQVKTPLLLCILKCVQLLDLEQINTVCSEESSVSSSKSSNTEPMPSLAQCKHYAFCKACRRRYRRIKDKYRKRKKHYLQNIQANVNALNVESLMKNIGVLERSLIDEMFEQLKAVYDTEMDMFKVERDDKIKNSLASHVQHFQRMKDELEESFMAREAALETNIDNKKRFLWGLAQALKVQHSQMTKAMQAVKKQTAELAVQEKNLKTQRTEAEESLKKCAEEMRQQIAEELNILERHLESMKTERDTINRERSQLDTVNSETKINNNEVKNYMQAHYNLLKDELGVVKMHIENATFRPSVAESATNTDDLGYRGMNNEAARVVKEVKPQQVVNDLKKQKNVNFSPCKTGGGTESATCVSGGSSTSQDRNLTSQRQISVLAAPARLQPELRPRTAPAATPIEHSMRERINESGWRKGAGEERSLFASTPILVPGDTLPFVGIIERRTSGRRHLLNRWRAIRRRVSPLGSSELAAQSRPAETPAESDEIRIHKPSSENIHINAEKREECTTRDDLRSEVTTDGSYKTREKSPRSVLKEAKEKLKTVTRPSTRREKSPSAMLREAKMRLRKLEIEAEAVARSYRDFRLRAELRHPDPPEESLTAHPVSKLETLHREQTPENTKSPVRAINSVNFDLEKYLKKYHVDLDLGQDQFSNKNMATVLKNPVPKAYSELIRTIEPIPKHDYLEKPIHEFRKLYYPNSVRIHTSSPLPRDLQEPVTLSGIKSENDFKAKTSAMKNEKNNHRKELELFNKTISNIHDVQNELTKPVIISKETEEIDKVDNLLTVEVENVNEVRELKAESSQIDMIVVVEGTIDSKVIMASEQDDSDERVSTKMTVVINPNHIDEHRNTTALSGSVDSKEELLSDHTDKERIFTKMTLVISPKQIDGPEDTTEFASQTTTKQTNTFAAVSSHSSSPRKANINNNDANNEEANYISNNDIEVEIRNDPLSEVQMNMHTQISDTDEALEDYPEDFSYDVDNYKSDNSHISLPKTSEDENFWD